VRLGSLPLNLWTLSETSRHIADAAVASSENTLVKGSFRFGARVASAASLRLTLGKVFHLSALYNCRKGQNLGCKRQNADAGRLRQGQRGGALAMHRTGQGNATVLRPRHQRRTAAAGATNEIGIVLYPGVQAAWFTVSRICSRSPPTLHTINSGTVDSRFALRNGSQRIAVMSSFRACTTAIRAETHSRGSLSYRQQWWTFRILISPPA
jgi:hypothetical protein